MRLLPVMIPLFAGCAPVADDLDTGTLEVSWTVGPDGCDAAGVADVTVVLGGTLMGSAACSATTTSLPRIEAGQHVMQVFGLDADGVERYASDISQVMVLEGKTTVTDQQVLTALTARLDVTWYFANGRLCGTNDVADVDIAVWEDGYLAAEHTAPCDDSEARVPGLPGGSYLVDLSGLDDDGEVLFGGTAEVVLGKGDQRDVEVRLDAEGGNSGGDTQ